MNYLIDCKGAYARCIHIPQNQRFKILLRMKLLIISLLLFLGQAMAVVKSQTLTLHFTNAPLEKVLTEIKKQTGYSYIANVKLLKDAKAVTVSMRNANVNDVLKTIFKDQNLSIELTDGVIYIEAKKGEVNQIKPTKDQDAIRGRVTDQDGKPLAGATIKVKGTNIVSVTDQAGEFTLPAIDLNSTIEVTFLGYKTTEIGVDGRKSIQITLQQALGQIDQIVVQGYGTTIKRLSTGNIATVDAKTIEQQPVMNALQALNGRVSGVQITGNGSIPGSPMNINIRGKNSLSAINRPLFVVDDVPFAMEPLAAFGYFFAIEPTNIINPSDIESITILKDADATAIYGSRGANGVVLITTKKAKAGKTTLDLSVNRGFSNVYNVVEAMNTEQYLQMRRDAFANSGATPTALDAPDLFNWDPNLDNNIMDWHIGNTADIHNAAASFSGGNQNTQFLLSGNYHQESNVFSEQDKYRRGNFHFTANHTTADQRLKVSFSGLYGNENNKVSNNAGNDVKSVSQAVPNYPYYDEDGNYNWLADQTNTYAVSNAYSKFSTQNINMNLKGIYNISKDFTFSVNLGLRNLFNDNIGVSPSKSWDPAWMITGTSAFNTNTSKVFLVEPQLSYNKEILKGKLSILLGSTIQKSTTKTESLVLNNYPSELLLESRNGGSFISSSTVLGQYNFLSAFSRINYNWQDRYLINANFRRDGSSRFGPNKRFGNFGSIGGAWILSGEEFLKENDLISYAKLRGSYGTTGSDGIGDFGYLSLYQTQTDYGTQKAILPWQIANADYQWEVTKKLEFAAELGLLKDRILLSTVWYRNRSGNQLVQYPLPTTTGFAGYVANLSALVQNKGWEFDLSTSNIEKSNFSWRSNFNLTIPRNELLEFPNIEQTSFANTHVIGKPLNSYLMYQLDKIDPATGLATVVDISGNGTINANSSYNNRGGDKIWVGSANPDWFAGLNNSFVYKGFQLDVFLQYTNQLGYNLFSSMASFSTFGTLRNGYVAYLDYWKEQGQDATVPKPFSSNNTSLNQFSQSDRTISDASFLRLKTVSLSYQVPTRLISRLKLSNLKLTAQGQNLLTFTNYEGSDPEIAPSSSLAISGLRTFSFGLNTSF